MTFCKNIWIKNNCLQQKTVNAHITILLAAFSIITFSHKCDAQYSFSRWDTVPVTIDGNTIVNPWAGGFNNPQFSDIDLNGDGLKDLFVYDRGRKSVVTFLNYGTPNEVDYHHAPEYQSKFPEIKDWALLVDYNCDGKEDLFTSVFPGMAVYRNDYNIVDGLQFTLITTLPHQDMYIFNWDIPAIEDLDGDGDIDVLTFDFAGSYLQYFKNLSMDSTGNCDTLLFVQETKCWGRFMEEFGQCTVLLDSCGSGKTGGNPNIQTHPGSTTLAIDLDGDNDKEVIIGDINCTNVYMLDNGGNNDTAFMVDVDLYYPVDPPSGNFPVDLSRFPATFWLDVDNDGIKDLLAAPNGTNVSENFACSWYHKNLGSNSIPGFFFQTDSFLTGGMIEVGEGAYPAFFDYNGDSLLDLVVGNYGYFTASDTFLSGLSLYENTGTSAAPVFELVTRDYANIYSLGLNAVYPAFGDLDDDGDMDMVIGEYEGKLHYFENIANIGDPANFVLSQPGFMNIDVGQYSTPQLVDVNCDWKLDLLIGEKDGILNYYENNGTPSVPDFSNSPTIGNFGGVNVKETGDYAGFSSPFLTKFDTSGEYSLLVGSLNGYIYHYTNIDNNLTGQFTLETDTFEGIREGDNSSVSGGDLDNDGTIDLLVGNYGGGVALFQNSGLPVPACPDTITPPPPPFSISIFPNPPIDNLRIEILGAEDDDEAEVTVYNIMGQCIFASNYDSNLQSILIDTDVYADGVYFCFVNVISERELPNNKVMLKFMVLK